MPRVESGAFSGDWRWRLTVGTLVGAWFGLVFGGADLVTAWRAAQGPLPSLETAFDRAMPFWPGAALIYLTVTPALIAPLFVLKTRREIGALAAALALEVALAGLAYLLWPVAATTTPPLAPSGALPAALRLADWVNLTYNSAPSLHVALSLTATGAMMRPGGRARNAALGLWGAAISASTLLTHQHIVADVASGAVLAALGLWAFSRWRRQPRPARH